VSGVFMFFKFSFVKHKVCEECEVRVGVKALQKLRSGVIWASIRWMGLS
jgi:hypothetical protein